MTSRMLTISAALVLLGGAPAAAQNSGWLGRAPAYGSDDYRAPYAAARRAAHDNGYKDGLRRGEQAARAGKAYNAQLERDYRNAQNGYNRSFGDRARYQDDYRGGFAQGYRDGYSQRGGRAQYPNAYPNSYPDSYPGNGRGYGYGGTASYGAFQNGAGDGYRKGLEDIEDRKSPDATRHKWYRSADRDYDNAYGSKDVYRTEYRRGFQEGYNRAFREGRRW